MAVGAAATIWTLGHGSASFDDYVEIISDYEIDTVVDIRSKPNSRWRVDFNRRRFEAALVDVGFDYVYLGDKLGGMPTGSEFYDAAGHTLYAPVSREPAFLEGLATLVNIAHSKRVALICLEEDPERCHRHLLLGKLLVERGVEVEHLRHAGYAETQAELDTRMGVDPAKLTKRTWRSPIPMEGGHGKKKNKD